MAATKKSTTKTTKTAAKKPAAKKATAKKTTAKVKPEEVKVEEVEKPVKAKTTKKAAAAKTTKTKAIDEKPHDINVPVATTTAKKTTTRKRKPKKTVPKKAVYKKSEVAPVQLAEELPTLGAYLTKDELANLLSLSSRRVEQLVSDGTIKQYKEGRAVKYPTVATLKQYIGFLSDKANGREKNKTVDELAVQKLKAEVALKESQGELHRLKTDIASGKYISIEEAKAEYSRMIIQLRNYILGIPNRITGRLTGRLKPVEVREVEKELNEITTSLLRGFVQSAVIEEDQEEIPTPKGRMLNEKKSAKDKV